MNKKLIAAAVSAAVVAPVAAYGDVTVYGRINNALDIDDISSKPDADGSTDISGVSSRFGIKYSQDMGNGLTASGQYEFSTSTDNEGGINDGRVAPVGISGAFGSILSVTSGVPTSTPSARWSARLTPWATICIHPSAKRLSALPTPSSIPTPTARCISNWMFVSTGVTKAAHLAVPRKNSVVTALASA